MEAESPTTPLAAPNRKPPPPLEQTRFRELFSGIYLLRTITVWFGWACSYFVAYGFSLWLPTLYVKIGGLPINDALLLSIIPWGIHISTIYVAAFLVDSIGRKPILIFGFLAIALGGFGGAFVVFHWHTTAWQVLFGIALTLGIGTILCTIVIVPYTAEIYPTRLRGLGVAAASGMNRLASIFAPSAVGALLAADFGIQSVFVMFGIVGLIGAFVLATLGIETKQQSLEILSP
jgi:putative MFS transporter